MRAKYERGDGAKGSAAPCRAGGWGYADKVACDAPDPNMTR